MDAKTYVKNVLVTEARDLTPVMQRLQEVDNIRLLHASAGLTSEITELFELSGDVQPMGQLDRVNLIEELGDLTWYIGIACDTLDCTDEVTHASTLDHMVKTVQYDDDLASRVHNVSAYLASLAGTFADLVIKKTVFYGKKVNKDDLVSLLANMHDTIDILCREAGFSVEYARERNIAKLKARYGEKFTEAAALERNLETERQILENK